MGMLWASLACFAVAAAGGATLAMMYYGQQRRPMPLAVAHGVAATAGFFFLIFGFFRSGSSGLSALIVALFASAAIAGLLLLASHLRKRSWHPIGLVIHGLLAFLGLTLLFARIATENA